MIIKGNEVKTISRDDIDLKVFLTKDDFPVATSSQITLKAKHGPLKSTINDRFYYILDGEGVFMIGGEEGQVEKGDLVVVPKNTVYSLEGTMTVLLVNVPAFDPSGDVLVNN